MKKLDIKWLGHDTIKLAGEKVVYIDPWRLADDAEKADIILITHEHYDHYSPEDIKKIRSKSTVVIGPQFVANQDSSIKVIEPKSTMKVKGVSIEAVPAYNIDKGFHPESSRQIGYIIEMNSKRLYHSGDTDLIPEMDDIRADIAFLCVSGKYVMDARQAAKAAIRIKPKTAIPIHYGDIIGTEEDAMLFKKLVEKKGIKVKLMKKE